MMQRYFHFALIPDGAGRRRPQRVETSLSPHSTASRLLKLAFGDSKSRQPLLRQLANIKYLDALRAAAVRTLSAEAPLHCVKNATPTLHIKALHFIAFP